MNLHNKHTHLQDCPGVAEEAERVATAPLEFSHEEGSCQIGGFVGSDNYIQIWAENKMKT